MQVWITTVVEEKAWPEATLFPDYPIPDSRSRLRKTPKGVRVSYRWPASASVLALASRLESVPLAIPLLRDLEPFLSKKASPGEFGSFRGTRLS